MMPEHVKYKKARDKALKEHLDNHTRYQKRERKLAEKHGGQGDGRYHAEWQCRDYGLASE